MCSKYNVWKISTCFKMYASFLRKFTLERIFCEKYIWFEKVASWHDVRLHKDPSFQAMFHHISIFMLRFRMHANWRNKFWGGFGMFIIYKLRTFDEFKDKTLGKLWFVICNHNMKGISFWIRIRISAQTREISTHCINETEQMHYSLYIKTNLKSKMIHICINYCAVNVKI